MQDKNSSKQADYGLDAPGMMKGFLLFGCILLSIGHFAFHYPNKNYLLLTLSLICGSVGLCAFILGAAMLTYSLVGKFRIRDLMLNMVNWQGDEQVLDIGTGRGLLLIGAAKRLQTGKAVGIDIWNSADLSENTFENTLSNLQIEEVADKVELKSEDARRMSFPDNSFDVVLSLLCLHNIAGKQDRELACQEIARVLKPNAIALVGDYAKTAEYELAFRKAGLKVTKPKPYFVEACGLMWLVEARKT